MAACEGQGKGTPDSVIIAWQFSLLPALHRLLPALSIWILLDGTCGSPFWLSSAFPCSTNSSISPPLLDPRYPLIPPQHACQHMHSTGQPAVCTTTEVIWAMHHSISAPPLGTLPKSSLIKKEGTKRGEVAKQARLWLWGTPRSSQPCHAHV